MPTLFVMARPIGNLEDMSYRAVRILGEVHVLACEDTRRTRVLLQHFDISPPSQIVSYHEHNEERVGQYLLKLLSEGKDIALCSNSGYPGVSDPGYRIIREAIEKGFPVQVVPGASAVPTALLVSGLPSSSYTFKGFPPRKPGPKRRFLEMERDAPHTLVFFESPMRVGAFLEMALSVLGNRKAAVCIELTKMFEEVHRGFLEDLAKKFKEEKIRGEVTLVIAGNRPKFIAPPNGSRGAGEQG
ncbi:MAG TPA: 16S rRNA (cytidine(1402)-2'-O)-methyltransferase, partial [Desulfobacterales bacterium]|nr:16S rRNA (cytidine(1402)-2'-O)-methyltransferase [Desulfobacterales bacterium]